MSETLQSISVPGIFKSRLGDFVYGQIYNAFTEDFINTFKSYRWTFDNPKKMDYVNALSRLNLWGVCETILKEHVESENWMNKLLGNFAIKDMTTIKDISCTLMDIWDSCNRVQFALGVDTVYSSFFMYRLLSSTKFMGKLNMCEREAGRILILYKIANIVIDIIKKRIPEDDVYSDKPCISMSCSSVVNRDNVSRILNITHTDHDGHFCAGVLNTILNTLPSTNLDKEFDFIVYTTGYNLNFDKVTDLIINSDEIWVTDLNFDIDTLKKMADINPEARWYYVDHHDRHFNSVDEHIKFVIDINNLFDDFIYNPSSIYDDRSACKLLALKMNSICFGYPINMEYIDYVAAWDTRAFVTKEKQDVFNMHYGMSLRDYDPTTKFGLSLMVTLLRKNWAETDYLKDLFNNDMQNGKTILAYKDQQNKWWAKSLSFEFVLTDENGRDYNGVAYNYIGDSYCFPDVMMDKYDICCTFRISGLLSSGAPRYTFTLYSNKSDVNCGKLCKYINEKGGGHAGAAGFTCTTFPFRYIYDGDEGLVVPNKYRMVTGIGG